MDLFQRESVESVEFGPDKQEDDASAPVQEGGTARPRCSPLRRIQDRDQSRCVRRIPRTDVLQEGLPGPRRAQGE